MTLPEFARKAQTLNKETAHRYEMAVRFDQTGNKRYQNAYTRDAKGFIKWYLAATGMQSWDDLKQHVLSWCPELAKHNRQFSHELKMMLTYDRCLGIPQFVFLGQHAWIIARYLYPVTRAYSQLDIAV